MEKKTEKALTISGLLLIVGIASIPLLCEYVMYRGDIVFWLEEVEKICAGIPSEYQKVLFLPVILRKAGCTITTTYRLTMLCWNMVAAGISFGVMKLIVCDAVAAMCGTCLYMLTPFRIYMCYDRTNWGKTYTPGQLFSSFALPDEMPGMGLALMMALLFLVWLLWTRPQAILAKLHVRFVLLGVAFCVVAVCYDGRFLGWALFAFAVLTTDAFRKAKEETHLFAKVIIPVMLIVTAMGISVYHCNWMTYTSAPMFLEDTMEIPEE